MIDARERAGTVVSGAGSIARAVGGQASRSVLSNGSASAGLRQYVVNNIGGESAVPLTTTGNYVGNGTIKRQAEPSGAAAVAALAESGDLEAVREHESAASSRAAPQGAVMVDYLRAVLPAGGEVLGELRGWLGDYDQRPVGWRSCYDRSASVLDGGIIAWCSDPQSGERQGVMVDLPGRACGALGERLVPFMAWCAERGKVRRVDLAIDDRRELVTYERLAEAIDAGALVTRAHRTHWIDGRVASTGERVGWTLYIGSRSSERCLRIYDKRLERIDRGAGDAGEPWVRIELEASGDYADGLAREVLKRGGEVAAEQINAYCRFTVPSLSDPDHHERWRVAPWWCEVIGSIERGASLACGEQMRITVDDLIEYVRRQAGPAMAAIMRARGGDLDWLYDAIDDGDHRLKPRHLAAIRAEQEAVPV